jgi:hypothetical protein
MNYELTEHAEKRKRQRGFSDHTMNLIVESGRHEPAPGGAIRIFFGNKEHQEIIALLKKDLQLLDKCKAEPLSLLLTAI